MARTVEAKKDNSYIIQRKITNKSIANEITSRITAKLIGFDDLFDPKTNSFLTESELVKKGAVIMTISMNKVCGDSDCVKKSRLTKEPTPFIRKTVKYQIIGNINWQSYINKRGTGDFIPADNRANGVENYAECKAVGITSAKNYTLNGVAFRVLEETQYFDVDGNVYPDTKALEKEYFKKQSSDSKQKEADKHGIAVEFDPKYRTTRIDSCDSIRVFSFNFIPTD